VKVGAPLAAAAVVAALAGRPAAGQDVDVIDPAADLEPLPTVEEAVRRRFGVGRDARPGPAAPAPAAAAPDPAGGAPDPVEARIVALRERLGEAGHRVGLPTAPDVARRLRRAELLLREERWPAAIAELERLLEAGAGAVVVADDGAATGISVRARALLRGLPPAARRLYLAGHRPAARRLLAAGRAGDREALRALIARHPACPEVVAARALLAGAAFEEGRLRLALGHAEAGLRLAGDGHPELVRLATAAGQARLALDRAARRRPPPAGDDLAWRWRIPGYLTPGPLLPPPGGGSWPEAEDPPPEPPVAAAADADRVYVVDGTHAVALDLRTGKLAWRTPLRGRGSWSPPAERAHVVLDLPGVVLCALPGPAGVVALDRPSGHVRWRRDRAGLRDAVALPGGRLVATPPLVGLGDAVVAVLATRPNRAVGAVALGADDGAVRWSALVATHEANSALPPRLRRDPLGVTVDSGLGVDVALGLRGDVLRIARSGRVGPAEAAPEPPPGFRVTTGTRPERPTFTLRAPGRRLVLRPDGVDAYGAPPPARPWRRGDDVALAARLGDPSWLRRAQATRELARRGVRAWSAVRARLAHADPEVRLRAARILDHVRRQVLARRIRPRVPEAASRPLRRAVRRLGLENDAERRRAVDDLLRAAERSDFEGVRAEAAPARAILRLLVGEPDARLRLRASIALLRLGAPDGRAPLERVLTRGPTGERLKAIRLVGRHGRRADAELLAPLLEDPAPAVREAAARGLAALGAYEALTRVRVR